MLYRGKANNVSPAGKGRIPFSLFHMISSLSAVLDLINFELIDHHSQRNYLLRSYLPEELLDQKRVSPWGVGELCSYPGLRRSRTSLHGCFFIMVPGNIARTNISSAKK